MADRYEHPDDYDPDDRSAEPKRKKFNIFSRMYGTDGPGVSKDELRVLEEPTLKNCFKLLWRKLWKLTSVNMVYILGNFPLAFLLLYMGKFTQIPTSAPAYPVYSALYGSILASPSPVSASLAGIFGRTGTVYVNSTLSWIFLALSFLVIFTFGVVNVGCTRIIRSMIREEPIFFWSDFFEAVRKNLRQGIIFGVFDAIICVMLVFDILWFNANSGGTVMLVYLIVSWATAILYAMMRMYIYLMMITFDLSMPKLLKNALLFAALGIKRNLLALIASVFVVVMIYGLMIMFLPIGIVAALLFLVAIPAYFSAYAAYPKIHEVMIEPYYDKDGNPRKTEA